MIENQLVLYEFYDQIDDCLNRESLALHLNLYTNLNFPQIPKKLDPECLFHHTKIKYHDSSWT